MSSAALDSISKEPAVGADDAVHRWVRPRMFRSDFLEFFSKVHPAAPALIFVPIVAYFAYLSVVKGGVATAAISLVIGVSFVWTLTEYLLHRFVFHIAPNTPLKKTFYFYAHGVHHQYPDDFYRLLMPPAVSLALGVLFWSLFHAIAPDAIADGLFSGMVLGYLIYDYSHFATHHVKPPRSRLLAPIAAIMKAQRKRHMKHHFDDHDRGFGVSTGFWDHVFGTTDGGGDKASAEEPSAGRAPR